MSDGYPDDWGPDRPLQNDVRPYVLLAEHHSLAAFLPRLRGVLRRGPAGVLEIRALDEALARAWRRIKPALGVVNGVLEKGECPIILPHGGGGSAPQDIGLGV